MAENIKEKLIENQESKEKAIEPKIYHYFWKQFDYTNKTHKQMLADHPYYKDPVKAASKTFLIMSFRLLVHNISSFRHLFLSK